MRIALNAVIAHIREVKALAKQLLPTVFAVRASWICAALGANRVVWIHLVELGVDAGRGGVEVAFDSGFNAQLQSVEVDQRRVVHHRRVVLAGEDVSRSTHVGSKLVDIFDAVHHLGNHPRIAEVANDKVVSCRC